MTQSLQALPDFTHPVASARAGLNALRLRLVATWYWRQDAQWRFVQVDEICACIGVDRDDWLGHALWETPNCMGYDFWELHRKDLQAGRPFTDLQCEVPASIDPSATLWLQISGEPIVDVNGAVIGYHGFGRDVTAQKRMELALRGRELRLRSIFEQSHWPSSNGIRACACAAGTSRRSAFSAGRARRFLGDTYACCLTRRSIICMANRAR